MQLVSTIGILLITVVALIGSFKLVKHGFGPFNLRVIDIILVATFATVLAFIDSGASTAL